MPHSVHKNQLEIDHIPKRKTYRKKKKENPYDPSKDFFMYIAKSTSPKEKHESQKKIDN